MSSLSLEASIRTCDVETGEASRIQSDRFLNPNSMVCIPWNGVNSKGQPICPDSFWTKTPGCNSAEDRVQVENGLRPQYFDYITLNAGGIQGNIYGNVMARDQVAQSTKELRDTNQLTGNFGKQWGANVYPGCNVFPYRQAMSQEAEAARKLSMANNSANSHMNRRHSGF